MASLGNKKSGLHIDITAMRQELLPQMKKDAEKAIADLTKSYLRKYIDDVRAVSAKRETALKSAGMQVNEGSVDDPLKGTQVRSTTDDKGNTRVFVAHKNRSTGRNTFDDLDKGSPPRETSKLMIFPRYQGNSTEPDSLDVGDVPVIEKTKSGKPIMVATRNVSKMDARNIYESISKKIQSEWKGLKLQGRLRSGRYTANIPKDSVKFRSE